MRLAILCTAVCSMAAASELAVKQGDFDKAKEAKIEVLNAELTAKKGETITIRLESNPSTGYSWSLLGADHGPLTLNSMSHEAAANTGVVGAPGTQVFEFTAKEPGKQIALVFAYGRSWQGLGERVYQVKVKVSE